MIYGGSSNFNISKIMLLWLHVPMMEVDINCSSFFNPSGVFGEVSVAPPREEKRVKEAVDCPATHGQGEIALESCYSGRHNCRLL
ncbi:hypothetical protein FOZ62_006164 [Perkinsus olseni]|uniref:Uncharacterized protein n=1 Tax=Perkinsus olseni TaxID=32597 RepID=A0A7J6SVH8_PEROL|nr:hypothetical protein FOZ62_006164 [Perkinsus olseni]